MPSFAMSMYSFRYFSSPLRILFPIDSGQSGGAKMIRHAMVSLGSTTNSLWTPCIREIEASRHRRIPCDSCSKTSVFLYLYTNQYH